MTEEKKEPRIYKLRVQCVLKVRKGSEKNE